MHELSSCGTGHVKSMFQRIDESCGTCNTINTMTKINIPPRLLKYSFATALVALVATDLMAHTGHGSTTGFMHGMHHPVSGWDHLLAMIAVGLLGVQMGGRMIWAAPLTFVSAMIGGALLGIAGMPLPLVESGILMSVLVLGLILAIGKQLPSAAALVLVGFFAIFHGHAHGAEMPALASGLAYGAGFALITATLHLGGIASAKLATTWLGEKAVRITGGIIAACGAILSVS